MTRHGYHDDCDDYWAHVRWCGAVKAAIRGRRGQALLREMAESLDALPEKRLIAHELVCENGEVCALGAVGVWRGIKNLADIDPEDYATVAGTFGIAEAMAREIEYENDDYPRETPEQRWLRMRAWVDRQLVKAAP